MTFFVWLLRIPILIYRVGISPILGPRCRFEPTCSAYALEALDRHGALMGLWLTVRRLARCHPWGGCGYDPVPDQVSAPRPFRVFTSRHRASGRDDKDNQDAHRA